MKLEIVLVLVFGVFFLGLVTADFFELNAFWDDGVKPQIKTSFCQKWGFHGFKTYKYSNGIYFDSCVEAKDGYTYAKDFKCQSDRSCKFIVELSSMHQPLETCEYIYGENTVEAQKCYCKEFWIEEPECTKYWEEKVK